MSENRIRDLFDRLHLAFGPQDWWPASDPFEVIVGAILTQRTTWQNAEQAIRRLRESGLLSAKAIGDASVERVAEAIRPAGFYISKAGKLKAFAAFLDERHDGELGRLFARSADELREELLMVFGIGEETADAILVYAAGKPSFVIDAYTRRLLSRLGWIAGKEPYRDLRGEFLDALPSDVGLLGEYHALIVRHGKVHCRSNPDCERCPVRSICAAGVVRGQREAEG
jgi:endonuclease-3 related protein